MRYLLLGLLLFCTTLFASIGKVTAIKGDVKLQRGTQNIQLALGSKLEEKDKVTTGSDGVVQFIFNDKTVISIGKNSKFDINEYFYDEAQAAKTKASFAVAKGVFKTLTGRIGKINPSKFKLKTKSASIGIRGTGFIGRTGGNEERIGCTKGEISVTGADGRTVNVPKGQMTSFAPGQPPAPPKPFTPTEQQNMESSSGVNQMPADTTTQEQAGGIATPPAENNDGGNNNDGNNNDGNADNGGDNGSPVVPKNDTPDTPSTPAVPETPVVPDIPTLPDIPDPHEPPVYPDPTGTPLFEYSDNIIGNADPKNAVYDVFHVGSTYNNSISTSTESNYYSVEGTYQNSEGTIASRPEFTIDNGVLNGTSAIYYKDYYGNSVDVYPKDGVQDHTTFAIENILLPNPFSTYKGIAHLYKYNYNGTSGDSTFGESYLNIWADSKQEFFYMYNGTYEYSGLTDSTDSYYTSFYNGDNIYYYKNYSSTYDDLVFGVKTLYTSLPNDGVSLYLDPWYFYSITDSSVYKENYTGDTYNNSYGSYLLDTSKTYIDNYNYYSYYSLLPGTYINWKNKNGIYSDIYLNTSSSIYGEIVIGKVINEDGNAKLIYTKKHIGTSYYTVTNSDIYLFGSEQQGLGGTETEKYNSTTPSYYTDTVAEFKVSNYAGESQTTPTGTLELKGFAGSYDASYNSQADNLTLTTDRLNTLSGTIKSDSTQMNVSFGGELGVNAAYITDNTLASFGFSGITTGGGTVNDGWIISFDTDSIDADTNTKTPGISWGAWGVDSSLSSDDINTKFWVAGVDRVEDIISTLGQNFTGSYVGNVLGTLNKDILDPVKSTIKLDFNFGSNTIAGTVNAVKMNSTSSVNIAKSFTNSQTSISGNLYKAGDGTSGIRGSFYNSGATTAGAFHFIDGSNTVRGMYKAAKQ